MTHLLVTNDFPPKVGGIQAYLWELWRRLDPDSFVVLTATLPPGRPPPSTATRRRSGIRIERVPSRVLAAHPGDWSGASATPPDRVGADLVVLDPVFPLGLVGPHLGLPYAVAAPRRRGGRPRPSARPAASCVARVLRHSVLAVSAGGYPAAEARGPCAGGGCPRWWRSRRGSTSTASGPCRPDERQAARADLGLPADGPLVVSVSRLVPRKGMDVLIDAAVRLRPACPDLTVAIAGRGRDADGWPAGSPSTRAPVRLLGGVSDDDLPRLVGAADVFVMLCRNRWLGPRTGGVRHRLPRGRRGRGAPGGRRVGRGRRGGGGRGDRPGGPAAHRCGGGGPGHRPAARRRELRSADGGGVPAAGRGILRL